MNLEHMTDLLRPLPAEARRCMRCPDYVDDPGHTSHLAATYCTQHPPDRLIRHAVITGNLSQWFSLLDTLEHSRPCRGRDLPARIRYGLSVARQRQKPRMVKG